jgi:O-acetyl-ADP-ribose deacetylase (regulator of RNase III)/transcriptional regulator with XRE-family HTH domain
LPFQIIRNDITKVKADAIVNTANPNVAVGDGVDSAIYKAAGKKKLLEARKKIGLLMPGEVAITDAFDLDAKYIIHASGPWWTDGSKGEEECLRSCYAKALQLAKDYGCNSIAFPLLATGTYGFPKELGIQIAVDTFTAFLEENDIEITLAVFGSEDVTISGKLVEDVASFVDDGYVATALAEEYRNDNYPREIGKRPESRVGSTVQSFRIPSFLRRENREEEAKEDEALSVMMPEYLKPVSFEKKTESLEDALKEIYTDSFEKHLQQLINKKGLKNSEVYATANISKQYFSKLLKGQVKPSKEKMLALAVGLHLNLDETIDFLRIAGYALSPISQTDKIVEYFIEHEDYNVLKIDIVLFDYGLDPLSNQKI